MSTFHQGLQHFQAMVGACLINYNWSTRPPTVPFCQMSRLYRWNKFYSVWKKSTKVTILLYSRWKNLKVANNWSGSQRWSDSRGQGFGWKWWASPQGHHEFPPKTIELLSNYWVPAIDQKPNQMAIELWTLEQEMETDDDQATLRESFSLVQNILFIGYTNILPAH